MNPAFRIRMARWWAGPLLGAALIAAAGLLPAAASAQALTAQTWDFNDASGTALTGVANSVAAGSAWTANIAGVLTNGSGSLRLGYNSTSTAYSYAPVNIASGGSYYGTVTFAGWDIKNGAASGSTRPIFNFGFRSAASTSSSLVADVQFTSTTTGVTMLVRDAQSDFTANAVVLPLTLPGALTVTLKVDKTSSPATYTATYAITGGASGSVTGNLGTTSTGRTISHVNLAMSGNHPGTANVAPLIDRINVQYDDLPVVILPPEFGRPGKPSNLTTYVNGTLVQSPRQPVGGPGVLLMGGGTEVDAAFTSYAYPIANGGDIVVLRISGSNGYQSYMYTDLVNLLPAPLQATLQPNSVMTMIVDTPAKANSDFVADAVAKANLIWMAGGDQSAYTQAWRGTALEAAVRAAYARGAVVGGTSAGMVVNGEWMYDPGAQTAVTSAEAVANPYRSSMVITTELFKLPLEFNLVPEPHFVTRDRMGRLLSFMARIRQDARSSLVYGVGLDEGTSLFIDRNGLGTFQNQTGSGNGWILREDRRGTQRVQVAPGLPLIYRNVQKTMLAPGQTFDFARGLTAQPTTLISVEGAVPVSPYNGQSVPASARATKVPVELDR
jgi:cyanophycinase-like exopeptidase